MKIALWVLMFRRVPYDKVLLGYTVLPSGIKQNSPAPHQKGLHARMSANSNQNIYNKRGQYFDILTVAV